MPKVYFDVSAIDRPFDDQSQPRIRREADAVAMLFNAIDKGLLEHLSSQMAEIEISVIPDSERREHLRQLLPPSTKIVRLTEPIFRRAGDLEQLGLKPSDAVHVAAAEASALMCC